MHVNAQTKPSFGIGAGMNMATMLYNSTNADFPTYYKPGFSAGLFADFPIIKEISLQTEIGYHVLGCRMGDFSTGQNITRSVNLQYLSLAFLPKWHIGQTGFALFAGVSFSYNLNTRIYHNDYSSGVYVQNIFLSGDIFGIAGAEYDLPCGLGFSLRYMQGMLNIAKNYGAVGYVFNRAFEFLVVFRIK